MFRLSLCLVGIGLLALPTAAAEFSDDFQTVATYDSNAILAPCYGGSPTKYTVLELLTSDVFNEQAVSGGGQFRISNSVVGNPGSPIPGFARYEFGVLGWVGLGIGCPGEPSLLRSTVQFTNDVVCVYGGYTYNYFQLQHAKQGRGDSEGEEYGADGGTGFAGVDDDGNGTTDDLNPGAFIEAPPSPEYLWPGPDGAPGVAGVDDDGINGIDDMGEFGWPGADGKPGIAGVDDDGNGTIDDPGELGWPGSDDSDDSDDTIGRWNLLVGLRVNLFPVLFWPAGMFLEIDPMSTVAQFSIRELWTFTGWQPRPDDGLAPGFYNSFTNYNYVFCANGTCFGAMMWVESDMANPSVTMGPILNSRHTELEAREVCMGGTVYNNGRHTKLQNAMHQGNSNFSHTFWVIEGDFSTNYPSPTSDLDNDRDVDVNDFLTFSTCFNGSLNPPSPACVAAQADIDGDGDVDVKDFLTFSACFNGSLNKPKALCFPQGLSGLVTCTPPDNDTCSGATEIGEDTIDDEIMPVLTRSLIPSCSTQGEATGKDLWFKYTPSCTGTATISTCDTADLAGEGAITDVIVAVYNSPCIGSELVCSSADNCPAGDVNWETVDVSVTGAVPVLIQVTANNLSKFGKFRLTITNDGCP